MHWLARCMHGRGAHGHDAAAGREEGDLAEEVALVQRAEHPRVPDVVRPGARLVAPDHIVLVIGLLDDLHGSARDDEELATNVALSVGVAMSFHFVVPFVTGQQRDIELFLLMCTHSRGVLNIFKHCF